MASQKSAVDVVTFSQLFETVVAYVNHNKNNNVEDLQTVNEMSQQIISFAENGGIAELAAVKEVMYKILLIVMAVRDGMAGRDAVPAPDIGTVAVQLVDQAATETSCDVVPEPALETTDEWAMKIEVEDGPTAVSRTTKTCRRWKLTPRWWKTSRAQCPTIRRFDHAEGDWRLRGRESSIQLCACAACADHCTPSTEDVGQDDGDAKQGIRERARTVPGGMSPERVLRPPSRDDGGFADLASEVGLVSRGTTTDGDEYDW